jgi:hypothetical protein
MLQMILGFKNQNVGEENWMKKGEGVDSGAD